MKNFIYHNPTKIDFGFDKEQRIGQHLADHKIKKVLLCFGSDRIKRDGLFDQVTKNLANHEVEYVELGGIVSNPTLSKVREAIQIAKEQQVDAILSVGGGSVLDSAKIIAAGVKYAGDVWDLFIQNGTLESALPIFAILTLAATGSEMNSGGVITNEATQEKLYFVSPHLFPKVSIVNPHLMKTVSRDYLVYSAADIIAHSIEGYFTAKVQPKFHSRMVEAIIKTVIENTEILLNDPDNYMARAEFAWAATQALNGLIYMGTEDYSYPNHMIEHALSALFNVPHGAGLSVIMPAWMKWYQDKNPTQFKRFAKEIFGLNTEEEGILALEQWFNKIGTPTRLSQLNIKATDLPMTIENILKNAKSFGIAATYTHDVINKILHHAR